MCSTRPFSNRLKGRLKTNIIQMAFSDNITTNYSFRSRYDLPATQIPAKILRRRSHC